MYVIKKLNFINKESYEKTKKKTIRNIKSFPSSTIQFLSMEGIDPFFVRNRGIGPKKFDGIAESGSSFGDGKLGHFSPEDGIDKIFDKNIAFQKKIW